MRIRAGIELVGPRKYLIAKDTKQNGAWEGDYGYQPIRDSSTITALIAVSRSSFK